MESTNYIYLHMTGYMLEFDLYHEREIKLFVVFSNLFYFRDVSPFHFLFSVFQVMARLWVRNGAAAQHQAVRYANSMLVLYIDV